MKKFYCNGKIVYMHITHNVISAKILLEKLGIAGIHDNVCQALDQDQDMLDIPGPEFDEAMMEAEMCDCSECKSDEELTEFFVDMPGDEEPDHYALPNGRSAPYGLTGSELAAMPESAVLYTISMYSKDGVIAEEKRKRSMNAMFIALDRDLIFATREKAVEAYNALFGDLYGTV